jgi:hypothetical protein
MASKIKVDNINKVSDDSNIIKKCGTTITLGASGDSIALATGASQTGFGRTGTVDWVTTVQTSTITAATGKGYFVNTTGGAITANLPAGAVGSIVSFADYAGTWDDNNFTISPNGTEKIGGTNANVTLSTEGQSVTLVYIDSTQGWINTMDSTSNVRGNAFITATGGTITTSGNDKIHKFTGPGTFTVSAAAVCAANNLVSYMVVAGGGGGGGSYGGGGGAGGYRELKSPSTPYTASPLDGYPSAPNRITVTATGYPIAVGAGGTGGPFPSGPYQGGTGAVSTFSTISSAGGGGGGTESGAGADGGSGGGGSYDPSPGGSGNTPPTTPAQGTDGGNGGPAAPNYTNGGGGGAGEAGQNAGTTSNARGAAGTPSTISGSAVSYAGGGGAGGGDNPVCGGAASPCGTGGAGTRSGAGPATGNAGTVNTGGGGGGNRAQSPGTYTGGAGGSGIVIIRYRYK